MKMKENERLRFRAQTYWSPTDMGRLRVNVFDETAHFFPNNKGLCPPERRLFTQDNDRQKTSFAILWSDGRLYA